MNTDDFHEMVRKLMNQGHNVFDAIKKAEHTGLFDNQVVQAYWDELNAIREQKQ